MANIVFISTQVNPPWGGGEELWSETALRAQECGHQVAVFISQRKDFHAKLEKMRENHIPLFLWQPRNKKNGIIYRILNKFKQFRCSEDLWKARLKKLPFAPDVICISQGGAFCSLYVPGLPEWLENSQLPYLMICHSNRIGARVRLACREKARELFLKAYETCFVAKQNLSDLERFLAIKLVNARIVHNPVSLQVGLIPDRKESQSNSTFKIACVARLVTRDKGQDLLLEALSDPVWKERDFQLDFYGSGPDLELLEDLILLYGLGDKVRVRGFESDIRKIWEEHALLVLPSISEGTPISLIEAQICGRAALVTRVDGNPEWVEEGKTGFLAEAPTVHHLRFALERAWENRHRWAEMGEAARAACLAKRDSDPAGTLLELLLKAAEREGKAEKRKS